MMSTALLTFAVVSFIAIATPGPTALLALANGSQFGVRRALFGMAGAMLADYILIGAVGLGLGALLAASVFWFAIVKWVGVSYLAILGARLLCSRGTIDDPSKDAPDILSRSGQSLFVKSLLVALSNPKAYILYSAFLPQFVVLDAPLFPQYIALATIAASINFLVMFGYAAMGSQAVKMLKQSGALWLDRSCGAALLILAGSLAFYRRIPA